MSQIFVSYSRKDSPFVDKLIAELENLGYSVWLDRDNIVGGDAWMASITEGITQCAVYSIVLSPNAIASDMVARELTMAFDKRKSIIPIRHQPYTLPSTMEFQLTGTQYIDFYAQDFSGAMQGLVRSLAQRQVTPPPKPIPLPVDSEPAPSIPASADLMKIIRGAWMIRELQPNSESKLLGRIDILSFGQFVSGTVTLTMGSSGHWHIESGNRLILQAFNAVTIIFDKISQDQLEGETLGTRQLWLRAGTKGSTDR